MTLGVLFVVGLDLLSGARMTGWLRGMLDTLGFHTPGSKSISRVAGAGCHPVRVAAADAGVDSDCECKCVGALSVDVVPGLRHSLALLVLRSCFIERATGSVGHFRTAQLMRRQSPKHRCPGHECVGTSETGW